MDQVSPYADLQASLNHELDGGGRSERLPKVSICLPTYNHAHWIASSITTILRQTYTDFELVVVDNSSQDATEVVVRSFTDPRVRYVRNVRNVGKIENFNRCIQEARGDWIAIYHDDDLYHPDILRRSVEILQNFPGVGIVCSAIHSVDSLDPGRILATEVEFWPEVMTGHEIAKILTIQWDCRIATPTALVRRAVYEDVGGWRPEYGDPADREFWLRAFTKWDFAYIAEPMALLRAQVTDRRVNAALIWQNLQSHVTIQSRSLEIVFRDSLPRVVFERYRLRAQRFKNFWRTTLWSLARGYPEVTQHGIRVFEERGLSRSARLLDLMHRSRAFKAVLSKTLNVQRRLRPQSKAPRQAEGELSLATEWRE